MNVNPPFSHLEIEDELQYSWNTVAKRFWNMKLVSPTHLYTDKAILEAGMTGVFGRFYMQSQKVYINLKEIQIETGAKDFSQLVSYAKYIQLHELGHFSGFPSTIAADIEAKLLVKHVLPHDKYEAIGLILGFFFDTLIDNYIFQKLKRDNALKFIDIIGFHRDVSKFNETAFWKFQMLIYQKLWGEKILSGNVDLPEVMTTDARQVYMLLKDEAKGHTWLGKVRAFTRIVEKYIPIIKSKESQNSNNCSDSNGSERQKQSPQKKPENQSQEDNLLNPDQQTDESHTASPTTNSNDNGVPEKNPHPVSQACSPSLEHILAQEGQSPNDDQQFQELYGQPVTVADLEPDVLQQIIHRHNESKLGVPMGLSEWDKLFMGLLPVEKRVKHYYHRRALLETLFVPKVTGYHAGPLVRVGESKFRLGVDRFKDFDPMISLRKGQKEIIPSLSMYKTEKIMGRGVQVGVEYPNVLIFLDISGSMPDPSNTFSPLVQAALVYVFTAFKNGKQAKVILYNKQIFKMPEYVGDTKKDLVLDTLLQPTSGATISPHEVMIDEIKWIIQHNFPVHVCIFTDNQVEGLLDKKDEWLPKRLGKKLFVDIYINAHSTESFELSKNHSDPYLSINHVTNGWDDIINLSKKRSRKLALSQSTF